MEIECGRWPYLTTGYGVHAVVMLASSYDRVKGQYLSYRIRNRGKHQPGDGNYTCCHITRRYAGTVDHNRYYLMYPGCHFVDDSARYRGQPVYCSFDYPIKGRARYVKAYHEPGSSTWSILNASSFQLDIVLGSVHGFQVAKLPTTLPFDSEGEPPRCWNVPWEHDSGLYVTDSIYRCEWNPSEWNPVYPVQAINDALMLAPPVFIENLMAQAYVDAINTAPTNDVNNIQNGFAAWNVLKSLVAGPQFVLSKGIAKDLADAWLQYRYVYSTTAMDIHETAEYIERSAEAQRHDISCHGYHVLNTQDAQFVAKCAVHLTPSNWNELQTAQGQCGLELSAYNAWDLVPYSFIVDWFLHIGDRLQYYDKRNRAMRLDPGECWYSLSYSFYDERLRADVCLYNRWKGKKPSRSPTFEGHQTSDTTIVKRAVDVLALSV